MARTNLKASEPEGGIRVFTKFRKLQISYISYILLICILYESGNNFSKLNGITYANL